jgi:hypothetical protein
MKRITVFFLLATALAAAAQPVRKPKLILAIVVDQFRYDYLTRFRQDYTDGLDLLLRRGAVFTNAHLDHFPTVTAIGHSTVLTGAIPSISGIVGNDWWDREEGRNVTSVEDPSTKMLGGAGGIGSSPRRMLVTTVGDEIKSAHPGKSKVIGISIKERGAILPAGHFADGAYWVDAKSGQFASSTFYFPDLPAWVKDLNAPNPSHKYLGAKWLDKTMAAQPGAAFYGSLASSPFGNEMLEEFCERAVAAEQLGRHEAADILAVSFSANDYIGHGTGPDSPEVREISIRTDRLLGKLFQFVDREVGLANTLVVYTADHGVAPLSEKQAERRQPGGRMPDRIVRDAVESKLGEKYGAGKWILSPSEHSLYLNRDLIREKKLAEEEVQRAAAEAVMQIPHVFRVYTRADLLAGRVYPDRVGRKVLNGYHHRRGADVVILVDPDWMFGRSGTTHGTAFSYDTHVPVVFMGPGVKSGRYHAPVVANDIAPTLATMLDVETPSGSVGRVLEEMFE